MTMTEGQAYTEMHRADREWEEAHSRAEDFRKQMEDTVSGRGEVIEQAAQPWGKAAIVKMQELQSTEIEKLQRYHEATQRWIDLHKKTKR